MQLKIMLTENAIQLLRAGRVSNATGVHGTAMQITQLWLCFKRLDHVSVSKLPHPQVYSLPHKDQEVGSESTSGRTMLVGTLKNFLCSHLWWEVHIHYSQLSLLLRHALSSLHATKLSQPAAPNGFSCLGDPAPSWRAAIASLLHTFTGLCWATATCLSTKHSGERQKVPLPIPPTTWGTVEQHHCIHVQHRIPTECHPGTQALSFSERCPMVQAKTSWKIQDEHHSLYLRSKRFLVLNYYRELRFFQAYENVLWICIGWYAQLQISPSCFNFKEKQLQIYFLTK